MMDGIDRILNINICCVSFCGHSDLLSQWRGYSGSGVGYAIGFSSATVMETAHNHSCRFARCIYDEQAQIEIIDELIEQVSRRSVSYRGSEPGVVKSSLSKIFSEGLIEFGAFFKDAAFQEEDEWRLVTNVKDYHDPAFDFRTGKSTLIPYYRLKVGDGSWRNQIAQVTVGPCPHPQTSQMAVMGLLVSRWVITDVFATSVRPLHPPVNISKIPYRNW
jgi:hypothetical protein